jgi:hypothetical protein
MKTSTKTIIILLVFILMSLMFKDSFIVSTLTNSAETLKQKIIPKPSCFHSHSYFNKLNDSVHNYLEESYLKGIKRTIKRSFEIPNFVKTGALVPLKDNEVYLVDTLEYSYAFLTPRASSLLFDIGKRFQRKIKNTNLKGAKLIVTSALRTVNKVNLLRKVNKNAVKYSAHLHGTTFDVTYSSFFHKRKLTHAEVNGLGEILSKTLFELRLRKKCWVTYERFQTCFHIVSR